MWHYVENNQSVGPISEEDFRGLVHAGKVTTETLVWNELMDNWLPASQTKLAFTFPGAQPGMVPPAMPSAVKVAATSPPAASEKTSQTKKTVSTVASIIGALIGFFAVKMLPPRRVGMLFGAGVVGVLCGLIPYFTGRHKNPKLAKIGLYSTVVAGLILGIVLALPVAIIFTIIIAVTEPKTES
jgi:hypothetical protein